MTFGERLQAVRKSKNITQEELAQLLNVTRQAVAKWEKDVSEPSVTMIVEISKALNVSVGYLLTGEQIGDSGVIVIQKNSRVISKPVIAAIVGLIISLILFAALMFAGSLKTPSDSGDVPATLWENAYMWLYFFPVWRTVFIVDIVLFLFSLLFILFYDRIVQFNKNKKKK